MDSLLIGTSGYDYPEWKGVFYPENLARKDFLSYYSTQFNALELNNTFYSMPTKERIENFMSRSENRLCFSVKASRFLTHEISGNWEESADQLKQALKPVNEKDLLSSVLFQFPQSFHYIPDNRFYLSHLIEHFEGFPVVIEFRHKEWIKESVFEGLNKRHASVVFCDMPALKDLPASEYKNSIYEKMSGSQFYLRLHGRNAENWYSSDNSSNGSARYDYSYTDDELRTFVPIIQMIKSAGKRCQIFFNNHPKGSGALNGLEFKEQLQKD